MHRIIEFSIFFVAIVLLQVLLFGNVNLGMYVHPLVYLAFLLLLPMETPAAIVLLCGLVCGVTIDVMSGTGGLNTIASLLTAFVRPYFLNFIVGRDEVKEGGIPSAFRLGMGRFMRYISLLIFIHCMVYFSFEALTFSHYHTTLLRVLLSSAVTIILVYFTQMLLPGSNRKTSERR